MQIPDTFLNLTLTVVVILAFTWLCFQRAYEVVTEAKKQESFASPDSYLPLRGRWLRYAFAALLAFLGAGAILLGVCFVWIASVILS